MYDSGMILATIFVCAGARCHMVWVSISEISLLADWPRFYGEITWQRWGKTRQKVGYVRFLYMGDPHRSCLAFGCTWGF